MRYYELARELGRSSTELMDLARSEGFDAKSHLQSVPAEVEAMIRRRLSSAASDPSDAADDAGALSEETDLNQDFGTDGKSLEFSSQDELPAHGDPAGDSQREDSRPLAPFSDEPLRATYPERTSFLHTVVLISLLTYLVLNRVIPDRFVLPFGSSIRLYEVVLVGLLGAWAVWIISEPRPFPLGSVGLAASSLLVLLLVAPFANALDMSPFQANGADRGVVRILLFAGLFLATYHLARSTRVARIILGTVVGLTAIQALLSIWEFLTQTPLFIFDDLAMSIGLIPDPNSIRSEFDLFQRLTGEIRAVATAPHPIVLSAVIALGGLIAAVWVVKEPRARRISLLILAVALLMFGLPAANSRTGFVIVLVALFPLLLLLAKDVPRLVPWSLLGLGMAVVGFVISPQTARLLLNSFTRPGSDQNTQVRLERFELVPDMMADHPFIGTGYLTHDPAIQIFDNAYNLAAVEVGAVGLLLFVLFFLAILVRNWAAYRLAREGEQVLVLSGVIAASAVLVGGMTFDAWTFDQFFPTALVVMGLAVGTSDNLFRRKGYRTRTRELAQV